MNGKAIIAIIFCVCLMPLGTIADASLENVASNKKITRDSGIVPLSCSIVDDYDNSYGTDYWLFHPWGYSDHCTADQADGIIVTGRNAYDNEIQYRKTTGSSWRKVGITLKIIKIEAHLYGTATTVTLNLGENMGTTDIAESGDSTQSTLSSYYQGTVSGNYYRFRLQYGFSRDSGTQHGIITILLDYNNNATRLDWIKMYVYFDIDLSDYSNNNVYQYYSGSWHQISTEQSTTYNLRISNPDQSYYVDTSSHDYWDSYTYYVFQVGMEDEEGNGNDDNDDTSNQDVMMTEVDYNSGDFGGGGAGMTRIGSLTYNCAP